jgi:hypothetical protein
MGKSKITRRDHHREQADDEVALLPQQAVSCKQSFKRGSGSSGSGINWNLGSGSVNSYLWIRIQI